MRNERKYKIISLMAVLLGILLFGSCFREPFRMAALEKQHHEEYVLKGAKTYAQNCVQCHGPKGEGVVGMPLNRAALRGDPDSPNGKDIYNMLTQTLKQGRKGNDTAHWERVEGGHITTTGSWMGDKISYTTMPAWHRDFGGPFDDDYIKSLVLFVMNNKPIGPEELSQWDMVGTGTVETEHDEPLSAPYQKADIKPDEKTKLIPLPDDSKPENAAAVALLRDVKKSQCLNCHTVGSKGAKIGPDLTHVGHWGVDVAFLREWIKDPSKVPQEKRMPVFWSASRATASPNLTVEQGKRVVGDPDVSNQMPAMGAGIGGGKLTDDEISIIATYLTTLK